MFDHVTIRASDRAASQRFYELVLGVLGFEPTHSGEQLAEWDDFSLSGATGERPVTERLHLGFVAPDRERVDEFWQAGTAAGYEDDGAPGPRPQYGETYYGGFLLDPDGNSAEAVHHGALRQDGCIDHIWFRVGDVAASRRFYELVGRHTGFSLRHNSPDRAQFKGTSGSFSAVAGEPTRNLHLAFGVDDNATVDAFHAELIGAGYEDNGLPGERPEYHAGYYGAFVLDPDGNNIELVSHNRG